MPCKILVSNKSNVPRAEILAIVDGSHVLSKNESMQSWIASGETKESKRKNHISNKLDKG